MTALWLGVFLLYCLCLSHTAPYGPNVNGRRRRRLKSRESRKWLCETGHAVLLHPVVDGRVKSGGGCLYWGPTEVNAKQIGETCRRAAGSPLRP